MPICAEIWNGYFNDISLFKHEEFSYALFTYGKGEELHVKRTDFIVYCNLICIVICNITEYFYGTKNP